MINKRKCKHDHGTRIATSYKIRRVICLDCGKLINKQIMSNSISKIDYLAFKKAKSNKSYGNVLEVLKALGQRGLNREMVTYMFMFEQDLDRRFKIK